MLGVTGDLWRDGRADTTHGSNKEGRHGPWVKGGKHNP